MMLQRRENRNNEIGSCTKTAGIPGPNNNNPGNGGNNQRHYGYFKCSNCHHKWQSAWAWVGEYQECENCLTAVYPYHLERLKRMRHATFICPYCRRRWTDFIDIDRLNSNFQNNDENYNDSENYQDYDSYNDYNYYDGDGGYKNYSYNRSLYRQYNSRLYDDYIGDDSQYNDNYNNHYENYEYNNKGYYNEEGYEEGYEEEYQEEGYEEEYQEEGYENEEEDQRNYDLEAQQCYCGQYVHPIISENESESEHQKDKCSKCMRVGDCREYDY